MQKNQINKNEIFFYEWLFIAKGMTEEIFKKLTLEELNKLKEEWSNTYGNL